MKRTLILAVALAVATTTYAAARVRGVQPGASAMSPFEVAPRTVADARVSGTSGLDGGSRTVKLNVGGLYAMLEVETGAQLQGGPRGVQAMLEIEDLEHLRNARGPHVIRILDTDEGIQKSSEQGE